MKDSTLLKGMIMYQCPLSILEERIMQQSKETPGRSDDTRMALQEQFVTFQQTKHP
jgi:hypothetical protein